MQAQLQRSMRLALGMFGMGALAWTLLRSEGLVAACCLLGSLGLWGLAGWPKRAPRSARFTLPLLMLLPVAWDQVHDLGSGLRLGATGLALGLWAGFGLRQPKRASAPAPESRWERLGLLGLFALWSALGAMGASFASLLWSGDAQATTCVLASGIFALVYHHARFYLNQAPTTAAPPPT